MPTALAIAVDREYSALVKVLCQNETVGQVIDIPFRNQTCVCTAALRGDADALKLLIGAKADINMRTDEARSEFTVFHVGCDVDRFFFFDMT